MRTSNTIPKLLDLLRPTLDHVADWVKVSRGLVEVWKAGQYQPKPDDRAVLVKAIRTHAARLLKLADAVEREGRKPAGRGKARRGGSERFTDWSPKTVEIKKPRRTAAPRRR